MSRAKIIGATAVMAAAVAAPMGAYFEGVFPTAYADPVGIPTECIGETGPDVHIGVQRFTMAQCIARYEPRLRRVWDEGLSSCIYRDVSMLEAGALISWADNVGVAAACRSTLVRMINAGAGPAMWCEQLVRWDKATKMGITITLPGLTKRRAAEREMCLGRSWRAAVVMTSALSQVVPA